jgi:hypothetical protein
MSVISYAVNAVLLVTIGIVVANILAETGIFSRLSAFTGPLCRVIRPLRRMHPLGHRNGGQRHGREVDARRLLP